MTASQELAIVPPKETALQVFQAPKGLDPWLQQIREEIDSFVPDVSTRKGREAIASIAHKVSKSKTALDGVGKDLVAELKEIPKKIDAERKRVRDTLDAWRDEVRAPLNEWEAAEVARVAGLEGRVQQLRDFAEAGELRAAGIQVQIDNLSAVTVDAVFEEFEAEAHRVKAASLASLQSALAARQKYEAEQAELEELRRKQAEQGQKDREAAIAREAEERARREAAEAAQAERDAVAKREADAKAASERRELELKLQAEQAEREKLEAQRQAEQAAKDSEARAQAAAEAERKRIADEKAEIERQAAIRAANDKHKGAINRAALEAFVAGGMPEDCAKQAVVLIAKGLIPNIRISY